MIQTQGGTWQRRFGDSMMRSLSTPKVMLDRGEGCQVWDVDGKRYLDFLAGIAVNALGHAHPVLVQALTEQASKLIHVSNYFATAPQVELAERLTRISGAGERGRVYFGNSGAEANEAAVKLARLNRGDGSRTRILALQNSFHGRTMGSLALTRISGAGERGRVYFGNSGAEANEAAVKLARLNRGDGSRTRILALQNSFHGRTMGSLALTGKPALREPFEPMMPGVEHIDTTIEALEAALDDTVAALFVEPIKGEAGVVDLPDGYLERARELTTRHGALLILDEIQTGIGRTGSWFAFQQHDLVPDAITVAKGIAGGVPIGALITFGDASDLFEAGQHGSTFGGNPLATAAANAVLGEIEASQLVLNAIVRGDQLRAAVEAIGSPLVGEIRGAGLLIGLGLTQPVAARIAADALEAGLIVNAPNDSSIRLAPPLIVGDDEIAEFTQIMTTVLKGLE